MGGIEESVNMDKEKQLSETLGRSRVWKIKFIWIHGSKEGELFRYKRQGFREEEKGSYMLWERWNQIEKEGTEAEEAWEERKSVHVCTMPKSLSVAMETDTHKYREQEKQRM